MVGQAASRLLDLILEATNSWLSSRRGFVHLAVLSLVWVGGAYTLLLLGNHRLEEALVFAYLALATVFSAITQSNLMIFSDRAGVAGEAARRRAESADERALLLLEGLDNSEQADRQMLAALAQALENQRDMLEAIVELARRDLALGEEIEGQVIQVERIAAEARKQHRQNTLLIRRLVDRTESASDESGPEPRTRRPS